MLMWMGLATVALAGTPIEEAGRLLQQHEPSMYVGCAPLGLVAEQLWSTSDRILAASQISPEMTAQLKHGALRPEQLAAAGMNIDGTVSMWVDGAGAHVFLPLEGADDQQRAFLEKLLSPSGQTLSAGPPWRLDPEDGPMITIAPTTPTDGPPGVVMHIDDSTKTGAAAPQPALLTGMPRGEPGCLVYVAIPPETARAQKLEGASLWLPLEPGPLLLRVRPREQRMLDLVAAGDGPVAAASSREPVVRLLVDVAPLEIMSDLMALRPGTDGENTDRDADLERDLQRLSRRLHIPGGTSLALYTLSKSQPQFAAVVPLESRRHKPLRVAQIRRLMRKLSRDSEDLSWESRQTLTDPDVSGRPVYFGFDEGRLFLSSDPAVRDELLAGTGTPWFSDAARQRAQGWPIYAEGSHPLLQNATIALGIRIEAATNTVAVRIETPDRSLRDLLSPLASRLPADFGDTLRARLAAQTPQATGDLVADMPGLCAALRADPAAIGLLNGAGYRVEREGPDAAPVLYALQPSPTGDGAVTEYRMHCLEDTAPTPR